MAMKEVEEVIESNGYEDMASLHEASEDERDFLPRSSIHELDTLDRIEESLECVVDSLTTSGIRMDSQVAPELSSKETYEVSGVDAVGIEILIPDPHAFAFGASASQWVEDEFHRAAHNRDALGSNSFDKTTPMCRSEGFSCCNSRRGSLHGDTHSVFFHGSRKNSKELRSSRSNSFGGSRGSRRSRRKLFRKTVSWAPSRRGSMLEDRQSSQLVELVELRDCKSMHKMKDHAIPVEPQILRRLCRKCVPESLDSVAPLFPSRALYSDLKRHLNRNVKPMRDDMEDIELPAMMPHWKTDYDEFKLPPLPPTSELTRRPHRKLNTMSGLKVFSLEAQILQQKVRLPAIKEDIKSLDLDFNRRVGQLREELLVTGMRMIFSKKAVERTPEEKGVIISFLKKRPFFDGLADSTLREISQNLHPRRYEETEVIFEQECDAKSIYIIVRGSCKFKESGLPPSFHEPTRGSLKQARESLRNATLDGLEKDWRGAKGLGLNPHTHGDIHDPNVLGLWDVIVPFSSPFQAQRRRVFTKTAIAASSVVEVLVLNSDVLVSLLEAEAIRERVKVLQDIFPLTKGKTTKEIISPSRVERKGRRITLHSLFKVSDIIGKTTLWMEGDIPPAEDAQVILILQGLLQIKSKGRVVDTVGEGVLIGEEALSGKRYRHTVVVHSDQARILFLSASDFLAQYGRIKMPQPHGNTKHGQDTVSLFYETCKSTSNNDAKGKSINACKLQKAGKKFKHHVRHKEQSPSQHGGDQNSEPDTSNMSQVARFQRRKESRFARNSFCPPQYASLFKAIKETTDVQDSIELQRALPKELPRRIAPPNFSEKRFVEDLSEAGPSRRSMALKRNTEIAIVRERRMIDKNAFAGSSALYGMTFAENRPNIFMDKPKRVLL